jgi:methyltransferase family protein
MSGSKNGGNGRTAIVRRLLGAAAKGTNVVLRRAGAEIVRYGPRPMEEFSDYIAFAPTIAGAKAAGMSVGDYIDSKHNRPGITQETIDQLRELGALRPGVNSVCEIGPGSGRYLEKTIAICKPARYEIYETAKEWKAYLAETYKVVAHDADGKTLQQTPSGSVELVMAHKVFPGTPFLTTIRYLGEMARVVAPGGRVVFDVITEACMDAPILERWLASGAGYQSYPNPHSRQYIVEFFARHHCTLDGSFTVSMEPGLTECMVFTRSA